MGVLTLVPLSLGDLPTVIELGWQVGEHVGSPVYILPREGDEFWIAIPSDSGDAEYLEGLWESLQDGEVELSLSAPRASDEELEMIWRRVRAGEDAKTACVDTNGPSFRAHLARKVEGELEKQRYLVERRMSRGTEPLIRRGAKRIHLVRR